MEPHIYKELANVESQHWWFNGRRSIARWALKKCKLPADATILDAGCGSGGNLALLAEFGTVYGFEMNETMRNLSKERGIATIEAGHFPNNTPFEGQEFNAITLFDVLEHVQEEEETLEQLHHMLADNGKLLITVPAFNSLWSSHDVQHHHHRRYRRKELNSKLEHAGFTIEFANYFNFWAFPAVWSIRQIDDLVGNPAITRHVKLPAFINWIFYKIMASERWLLTFFRLPFGVSIVCVASKRN